LNRFHRISPTKILNTVPEHERVQNNVTKRGRRNLQPPALRRQAAPISTWPTTKFQTRAPVSPTGDAATWTFRRRRKKKTLFYYNMVFTTRIAVVNDDRHPLIPLSSCYNFKTKFSQHAIT